MNALTSIGNLASGNAEYLAWAVVEALSTLDDTVGSAVAVTHWLRDTYGTGVEEDEKIIPNPFFLANGHGGTSKKTASYLKSRSLKTLGGGAVGVAGALAAPVSFEVDIGGILNHGNAMITTTGHLLGIRAAGASFKRSETVTRWVDVMMTAKTAKMGVRTAGLAGSAIPIPGFGMGSVVATAIAKLGIRLTLSKLVARTAMEVHWRAKQETEIGRFVGGNRFLSAKNKKSGPCGPASAMFYEVFTKRGFTRIFGKYDTAQLIAEPGGWMALNDKLMLM